MILGEEAAAVGRRASLGTIVTSPPIGAPSDPSSSGKFQRPTGADDSR